VLGARSRLRAVASRDARALRGPATRTAALRWGIAVAAVALLAASVATARDLDPRDRGLLESGSTGVVVLDLSLSILDDNSGLVRRTLQRLIDADVPVGLVVFSDVPYELLPPGTPPSELRPLIRLLTPTTQGDVVTPWSDVFRSGTAISKALQLAQDMLEGDNVRDGSILLVSDLETSPDDVPATARVLQSIKRSGTPVQLLALGPSSDARALFGGILGPDAFTPLIERPNDTQDPPAPKRRSLPMLLLALGALFLVALALHERYAGRLALPAQPQAGEAT
jgi:von Willebrand factor type A domain